MTALPGNRVLLALLLLIPLAYLPWAEDPSRLFREGLFRLAAIGVALLWLYGLAARGGRSPLPPRGPKRDFALFAAGTAALLLSALAAGGGYGAALNVALGGLLFVAFRNGITKENARGWALLFLIPALCNALLGVAQYAGHDPFFKSLDPAFHSVYRRYLVAGFMDSPNMLAPFLASFVPLCFAYFLHTEGRKAALWGGAAVLLLLPIAFTRNIGGIAPLGAVLGLLLLYYTARAARGERRIALKLGAAWLAAAVALGAAGMSYARQDETSALLKRYSIDERRMQNGACLMMFKGAPLIGKGPGFFYRHFVEYRRAVWLDRPPLRLPDRVAHQAHNDYLQLLAEGGLLAALPFGALLTLWLCRHAAALRRCANDERLPLLAGGAGGFWIVALNGLGSFPFHIAPLAVAALFWGALAAVMVECGPHE